MPQSKNQSSSATIKLAPTTSKGTTSLGYAASTPAVKTTSTSSFNLKGFITSLAQTIYSTLQGVSRALTASIYTPTPTATTPKTTPTVTFPYEPMVTKAIPSVTTQIIAPPQPKKTTPPPPSSPSVVTPTKVDERFTQAFIEATKKAGPLATSLFGISPTAAASTPPVVTPITYHGGGPITPVSKTTTKTGPTFASTQVEGGAITQQQLSIIPTTPSPIPASAVPPLPSSTLPETRNIVEDVVDLTVQRQQQTSAGITNVPPGATTYIFKDPIGGSTPVFEYVIRPGENLTRIAQKFGVSIEDILRLNKDRTDAIKTPGVIIAGKSIRIPAIQQQVQPSVLTQTGIKTVEDINKAVQEQLKTQTPSFTLDDIAKLIEERVSEPLQKIQQIQQQYIQLADPNFYVNQYNALMDKLGISQDLAALRDIRAIMRGTLEDVLKEAAAAGGLVTQSQVAEIVNFRHGILKQQAEILSDIIEEKERMLDRLMKYTLLGRQELEKMLDRQLRIAEMEISLKRDATKWAYDIYQDLKDKNLKRLEFMVKEGVLHTASPEHLAKYVDPSSLLYTGLTSEDLIMMLRISYQNALQEKLKTQQLIAKIEQIQAKLEQQMYSLELREKELEIRRERLELEKEKLQKEKRDWSIFKTK